MNPFKQEMIYLHIFFNSTSTADLLNCEKNACLKYCEFDLEDDLGGVPHTWYLSGQPTATLLKFVWRAKCVGLHRK